MTIRPAGALMATVALAVSAALWHFWPAPVDTRPITLPPTFMNLTPWEHNFMGSDEFQELAQEEFGEAGLAGTTFGSFRAGERPGLMLNLIAVRTDMTGKLDVRAAVGDRAVGNERCTSTLEFKADDDSPSAGVEARVTTYLLCWRASDDLSVSALVMGGAAQTSEEELAAAVEAVYTSLE